MLGAMDRQTEFVLRAVEDRNVKFIRLWFTDVLGFLKSVAIAPAELEGAFAEGVGFDGSAIEGYARVFEADMIAHPDPTTFQLLPWRSKAGTARMFCDITMPDGSPAMADPRNVLKRALKRAADMGFTFYTHPEIEFFLLRSAMTSGQEPTALDDGGYFDHTTMDEGTDFRRDAISMLEQMGISVEFSHHEGAPGQHEIDLRYADALSMADNIMTFKVVLKEVAVSQGIRASFMPKPFTDHAGSGMHTHVSLFEGDQNAFYDAYHELVAEQDRQHHRRPARPRQRDHRGDQPVGESRTSGSPGVARRPATSVGDATTGRRWCASRCSSRTRPVRPASSTGRSTRPATRTWPTPCC